MTSTTRAYRALWDLLQQLVSPLHAGARNVVAQHRHIEVPETNAVERVGVLQHAEHPQRRRRLGGPVGGAQCVLSAVQTGLPCQLEPVD